MTGLVLFSVLGYISYIRIYDWWYGYGELF